MSSTTVTDRPAAFVDAADSGQQAAVTEHSKGSPISTVVRGALALLATQPITWAASLLATAVIPRYLTDREMGQYTVALTVAGLAGTVVALGVPTSLVRAVASRPLEARRESAAALALVLGLSTVTAIVMSLVWSRLGLPASEGGILPYVLLGMVVTNGLQIGLAILVGLEQHARFAWANAAASSLSQVASVAVLFAGGSLVEFVAAGVLAQGAITVIAWQLASIKLDWAGATQTRMYRVAREGLPFLGTVLANRLRGDIEIALLAFLLSEQVVGWWTAASRIVSVPMFIPILIATPLLPALSQHGQDRPTFLSTLRRSLILVVLVTVPLGALIGALAPAIPERLGWAPAFAGAIPLMMVLSVSMPMIAVGIVLGTALIAVGQERRLLMLNIVTTIVSASAIPVTIWIGGSWLGNGAIGASLARLLTETVMIAGAIFLLPRGSVDWGTVSIIGRIVLAAGGLVAVTTFLLPISPELAGIVGGLVFVAAALLLRVVQMSELRALQNLVLGRLRRAGVAGRSGPGSPG